MGDVEPIDGVIRKIKKKWDQDPENWSVLGNIDKDGNNEMLISQAPNTWWLKMRAVNAYQNMAFGKELTNLDTEINKQILADPNYVKKLNPQEEMLRLFGMVVPSKKDMIYTSGVELHSPKLVKTQKEKIEEKESEADRLFRKYLREKWAKEQFEREGLYM